MKNYADQLRTLQALVFAAIILVILTFAAVLFIPPPHAHGAVIDPHLTSPAYITVVAEEGDTAYSIARHFTPRGKSAMPLAADFVAFNNLNYNKRGNPVIHARRLYAFPTKMSRDRMRATVLSLNTASRDWHREHHNNHSPVVPGPGKVQSNEVNKGMPASGKTAGYHYTGKSDMIFAGVLAFLLLLGVMLLDYERHVGKLDAASTTEEKPPADANKTNMPSPAPEQEPEQEKGATNGAKESRALPLEYRDPKDPYEDPNAPTGLTLGEKIVNVFRAYPMKDVAEALEHDVIPIAALKMEVRYIKLRNIPESVRKHSGWGDKTLHNLITHQERTLRDIGKNTEQGTPAS